MYIMKKKRERLSYPVIIILILLLLILVLSFIVRFTGLATNSISCTGPYKEEIKKGCTSLTNPSYTCCTDTSEGFNCYTKIVRKFTCRNPDGILKSYQYISLTKNQIFDDKSYPLYDSVTTQKVRCKAGFPEVYESQTTTKEYKKEYNKVLRKDQSCLTTSGSIIEKSNVFAGVSTNFADGIKINHPTYARETIYSSSRKYIDTPLKTGFKTNHEALYDETLKRTAIRCEYETESGETRYSHRWFTLSVTNSLVTNNQYGKTNSSGTCTVYFKPKESIDGCPLTNTIYKVTETKQGSDYSCYNMLNVLPGNYSKGELDSSAAFVEMDRGIITKVMPIDETPQETGESLPFLTTSPGISGYLQN